MWELVDQMARDQGFILLDFYHGGLSSFPQLYVQNLWHVK